MTISDKLRGIADLHEQDPADLSRIAWRLDLLLAEIRRTMEADNHAWIDDILKLRGTV